LAAGESYTLAEYEVKVGVVICRKTDLEIMIANAGAATAPEEVLVGLRQVDGPQNLVADLRSYTDWVVDGSTPVSLSALMAALQGVLSYSDAGSLISTVVEADDLDTSYDIDWSAGDYFDLVMIGATTLTQSNFPTDAEAEGGKTIVIKIRGNFALTVPAEWNIQGTYDGAYVNLITVASFGTGTAGMFGQIVQGATYP